jgi:hypothetical protein
MTANLETLAEFAVQASLDGDLTLEHWQPDGALPTDPWCWWETSIGNGTTLPQLAALARQHLAEKHPKDGPA